jgi:hypothetical protein
LILVVPFSDVGQVFLVVDVVILLGRRYKTFLDVNGGTAVKA